MSIQSPPTATARGPADASAAAIAGGVRPRRFGTWYVAEHRIRGMRTYYQTLIVTAFGNPLVYLFALGVGLASLVDRNTGSGGFHGVNYLAFVAPALIATAAVTVAAEEFTYPIIMGFKWNPLFFAMNAAPLSSNQIVNGTVLAIVVRMFPTVVVYFEPESTEAEVKQAAAVLAHHAGVNQVDVISPSAAER